MNDKSFDYLKSKIAKAKAIKAEIADLDSILLDAKRLGFIDREIPVEIRFTADGRIIILELNKFKLSFDFPLKKIITGHILKELSAYRKQLEIEYEKL